MTQPAPSWNDLYNDAKAELVLRRPDLTVDDGDIADMLMAAIAAVGDRAVGYTADQVRATFVDGARGADLTKLADDHWGLTRVAAVKAIGSVSFSRVATVLAGTIPTGTVVGTETDATGQVVQFVTDADVAWTAGQAGPKTVAVTAVTGGLAGNLAAGKITRISSTLFDTFSVAQSAPTLGGAEEEGDDELRARIRIFSTTLRRGTLSALEYGALQVPQVKNANAVEDSGGIVTVYVTDIDGASNAQMVSDVLDELEEWRAAGALVNVTGGALYALNPIEITLTVRAGTNTAAIASDVKKAIVARIGKLRIGETCKRELIQQAALNVDLDNIIGCTVVLPAADVAPSANQIIRTDVSYITVT